MSCKAVRRQSGILTSCPPLADSASSDTGTQPVSKQHAFRSGLKCSTTRAPATESGPSLLITCVLMSPAPPAFDSVSTCAAASYTHQLLSLSFVKSPSDKAALISSGTAAQSLLQKHGTQPAVTMLRAHGDMWWHVPAWQHCCTQYCAALTQPAVTMSTIWMVNWSSELHRLRQ